MFAVLVGPAGSVAVHALGPAGGLVSAAAWGIGGTDSIGFPPAAA